MLKLWKICLNIRILLRLSADLPKKPIIGWIFDFWPCLSIHYPCLNSYLIDLSLCFFIIISSTPLTIVTLLKMTAAFVLNSQFFIYLYPYCYDEKGNFNKAFRPILLKITYRQTYLHILLEIPIKNWAKIFLDTTRIWLGTCGRVDYKDKRFLKWYG